MSFGSELKEYMNAIGFNAKTLSDSSGISPAQISRYINDKRTPRNNSVQFEYIVNGIYSIAKEKGIDLSKEEISETLQNNIPQNNKNIGDLTSRLNKIITELRINVSDLAYSINYDSSFISRIRNGTRSPSNTEEFAKKVADYIAKHFDDQKSIDTVSELIFQNPAELSTREEYSNQVFLWLTSQEISTKPIEEFLSVVNSTVASNNSSNIEALKYRSAPIIPSLSKHYFGVEGMKKAEADFFKYTILSHSTENIFICSDIDMKEVDNEQFKKLVRAANILIDKGIELDLIHNINRPINEMLLGLQGWIPIYINGNVNPYYFEKKPDGIASQILATSGTAAIHGECIGNDQESVYLRTTTNKKQVEWYNKKKDYLIAQAKPLMKVYRGEDEEAFNRFINEEKEKFKIVTYTYNSFKNIDFYVNSGKWISVNKINYPKVHFVIFNERLIHSIEELLKQD